MAELSVDHRILLENAYRDDAGVVEEAPMLRLYANWSAADFTELADTLAEHGLLESSEPGNYRITGKGRKTWERIIKSENAVTRRDTGTWQRR